MIKEYEEGVKAQELCRKYGISDVTFCKFKGKFGGTNVSDTKKLRALENENDGLKRMLADAVLDNAAMKELTTKKILTPDVKRRTALDVMDRHGLNECRACELADLYYSVFKHKKRDWGDDTLSKRLRELANKRRRFVYRRLCTLLAREGFEVNHKKLFRLYREEGMAVRRLRSRKRALGAWRPILVLELANQSWSLDFVSGAFEDDQRFRELCIVDDRKREALHTVVDRSLPGARMTRELY